MTPYWRLYQGILIAGGIPIVPKSLYCFLLSSSLMLLTATTQVVADECTKVSNLQQRKTLKLYKGFFPYEYCFLVTINRVVKKGKILRLDVIVHDVYQGNYQKGSSLSLSFNELQEGSQSFATLSAIKNTRQIIAFNFCSKNDGNFDELIKVSKRPIGSLCLLSAETGARSSDIAQIKSIIKNSFTEPSQVKAAFQKWLETKWSPARINDFCRLENQWNTREGSVHTANLPGDWFNGTLHADKVTELRGKQVRWQAAVHNNLPGYYNISVLSPEKNISWNLEIADPSMEEWTDEHFMIHRVGCSINQAAFAHWFLNHRVNPALPNYKGLFNERTEECALKNTEGKTIAYQCRLTNGQILRAFLSADTMQNVERISIDGKESIAWTEMYNETLTNLAKCNDVNPSE